MGVSFCFVNSVCDYNRPCKLVMLISNSSPRFVLLHRITTYNESTKAIIEHYRALGKVRRVAAVGSPDDVTISFTLLSAVVYFAALPCGER